MKKLSVRFRVRLFVSLLLAVGIFASSINAYAFISPKRVIIKDEQRTGRILIANRGDKTLAYSFEWQQRVQAEGGKISLLDEGVTVPGHRPVSDYLVFSPRRMVLRPGERQIVRIFVRRTADMVEGEYHSHLLIKADPVKRENAVVDAKDSQAVGGLLSMHTYASLPIFLHQGATSVSVKIKDASFYIKDGKEHFNFEVDNASTRSLYLQPEITCTDASGVVTVDTLATIRLYSEVKSVSQEIPIATYQSFKNCTSMSAKLLGTTDFQYARKPVAEALVRK